MSVHVVRRRRISRMSTTMAMRTTIMRRIPISASYRIRYYLTNNTEGDIVRPCEMVNDKAMKVARFSIGRIYVTHYGECIYRGEYIWIVSLLYVMQIICTRHISRLSDSQSGRRPLKNFQ